jgi:hypothetical protein
MAYETDEPEGKNRVDQQLKQACASGFSRLK